MENLCPVGIAIAQVGAGRPGIALPAGARQPFLWPAIPEHCATATRQLLIASSTSALSETGVSGSGWIEQRRSVSGWMVSCSHGPFSITSGAAYQRALQWPNGLQTFLTIQVSRLRDRRFVHRLYQPPLNATCLSFRFFVRI
jgi:hypothetical protein